MRFPKTHGNLHAYTLVQYLTTCMVVDYKSEVHGVNYQTENEDEA